MKFFGISILMFLSISAFAQQQPMSPEEQEKQMRTAIDEQIENYADLLKLEDWQIFYLDSIMTHDYYAMKDELDVLSKAKVGNSDAYVDVQDKWLEQMHNSYQKIFNEEQWQKYLKSGAARDKKARDKRAAKRNKK